MSKQQENNIKYNTRILERLDGPVNRRWINIKKPIVSNTEKVKLRILNKEVYSGHMGEVYTVQFMYCLRMTAKLTDVGKQMQFILTMRK